jgi:hypothetical protein
MQVQYYQMLNDDYSYTQNTPKLYISGWDRFSLQLNYADSSPSAKNFLTGEAQVVTATFPSSATLLAGDYILINDIDGSKWAVAANLTGSDPAPTGAIWAAIPSAQKAQVDLHSLITFEVASAYTGTPAGCSTAITITANVEGVAGDVTLNHNYIAAVKASLVAQKITYTAKTAGVAGNSITVRVIDSTSGGLSFTEVANAVVIDLGGSTSTALDVVTAMAAATLVDVTGTDNTDTIIVAAAANLTSGAASTGSTIAQLIAAFNVANPANTLTLTAGVGTQVPQANIVLSGGVDRVDATAIQIAAAFEVALDNLASVPFSTNDTAADGTMIITNTKFGVAGSAVYNADESGAGTISVASTNIGVNSAVNVTANTITITAHGLETGLKLQASTTGTLPAGLSISTDYFVIKIDDNTIKLASSLAYALAGTAIDITNQGADGSTNTLTATSISASAQLQKSNDGVNWVSEGSAVTLTTPGSSFIANTNCSYRYIRFALTVAGGVVALEALLNGFKIN